MLFLEDQITVKASKELVPCSKACATSDCMPLQFFDQGRIAVQRYATA